MDDKLKVEDILLIQSGEWFKEIPVENITQESEELLLDRWKKWVEAVNG